MKKKGLILFLCLALVTTFAVNGTFAQEVQNVLDAVGQFFQNLGIGTPEEDKTQLDVKLVSTNEGVLAPAYYDGELFDWENLPPTAMATKTTYVENTKAEAAYVRICIAVKQMDVLKVRLNSDSAKYVTAEQSIVIGGEPYTLYTFDYKEKLTIQNPTPKIVHQFALAKETNNHHMVQLGDDFVKVQSFAIQASAFENFDANSNKIANGDTSTPRMTAHQALEAALGDINKFNPFK